MHYIIKYEPQFKRDYKVFKHEHSELIKEFKNTVNQLIETGKVREEYHIHQLNKRGGKYSDHLDYHLSDGKVDIVVLYKPHKTNPIIRLVRIGDHGTIFGDKEK